jgi:hypothetical protein
VSRVDVPEGFLVREAYTCDSRGKLRVAISTNATGYVREYNIGHWAKSEKRNSPPRNRRSA